MTNLTLNEIRIRAAAFAKDFGDASRENAESQIFWHEFFQVFGLPKRRVVSFEKNVQKLGNKAGRIDVFWPGTLLIEQKSRGKDLDAAFTQGNDYFHGLSNDELPHYVIVSDFARIRLVDVDGDLPVLEFELKDLPQHIERFGFIAGYEPRRQREDVPLNQRAVDTLGELHDLLKADGFTGHRLEVLLTRLLFCLFADDTGIFTPKGAFEDLVTLSNPDGSTLGADLSRLFGVLNTPTEQRQKSLDERFGAFPYVNGRLYADKHDIPEFSSAMRAKLLACCGIAWGAISPAVFGAMFQKIISLEPGDRRRQMGAHYTSESNILKLIKPLFLDALEAEFENVKRQKNQLFEFQKKLRRLVFLDPACGCGNFLVITYRELRRLELRVLKAATAFGSITRDVFEQTGVNVDQFYGIEVEDFPAQIAQVAMWLVDHQMNLEAGQFFGDWIKRIPLDKSAEIRHGNALRIEWADFCPPGRLNYILGNPPFVGKKERNKDQKEDLEFVCKGIQGAGVLDYVCGWYLKAAQYLVGSKVGEVSRDRKQFADVKFSASKPQKVKTDAATDDMFVSFDKQDVVSRSKVRCAFVSTNSITQGEQVGLLWSELQRMGMHIQFAHRTFQWTNDAPGKAAVHCVIIGFGVDASTKKTIFDYAQPKSEPIARHVDGITAYLSEGTGVLLQKRSTPICPAPGIVFGSKAVDFGHFVIDEVDLPDFLLAEPAAKKYVREFIGGEEFLNGTKRYCLWLQGISPQVLKAMPSVLKRVEAVRTMREKSVKLSTRVLAKIPTEFGENRQPNTSYLLVPKVSSETRNYLPMGFYQPEVVINPSVLVVPQAGLFEFGVLQSHMHMAWMRYVCGRMKSDYQYSAQIVYNNFPWPNVVNTLPKAASNPSLAQSDTAPDAPEDIAINKADAASAKLIVRIEVAAQGVLDARFMHQNNASGGVNPQHWRNCTIPPPCPPTWPKPTPRSTKRWTRPTARKVVPAVTPTMASAWHFFSNATPR